MKLDMNITEHKKDKYKEPDNNIHTKYRYEFELKNEIEYKKKIAANTG